jgi:very-short-patch-repair endonuclease
MTDIGSKTSRAHRRAQLKRHSARELRANATECERRLWALLRRKQFLTTRFRRQQPIGPYIADFYCSAAKLIVELDGSQHGADEKVAYDARRTAWLEQQGYLVLRFSNEEFLKHREAVLEGIERAVRERSPLPPPLREGRKREAFSGRGAAQVAEIFPSPKFAPLRCANCRPSLKGRVGTKPALSRCASSCRWRV